MKRFIRFVVRTDHSSRTRCTGIVTMLRILGEEGKLPSYHVDYSQELFDRLNDELPCPPFHESNWDPGCVSWFKDTPESQEWISVFRDIIAILEDSDVEVGMLTTESPGKILYEDEFQVVALSRNY